MTTKQSNNSIKLYLATVVLAYCVALTACADSIKPPNQPSTESVPDRTRDQPKTEKELDLVAILIKFTDLTNTEPMSEKFERYFKTKVVLTLNQATGLPESFEGTATTYGITATGSNDINKVIRRQGIWIIFPRNGQCVLLKDLMPYVSHLKKSTHLRSPVFREDDPTQWEFYETYSKEEKLNRIAFYFAFGINSDRLQPENKRCLREMTSSQYLP